MDKNNQFPNNLDNIKNSQHIIDNQTTEENFDSRTSGLFIREGDLITIDNKTINKISSYKFDILIKDKPTFSGELSRTEMELIYRLYSSEGANLAVKSLAREFTQYTQQELKKILRAFSITKACSPLAPHQIEEMNIEDAVGFSVRMKENAIIKKVEEERIRHNEQRVKELTKEVLNLKDRQNQLKTILGEVNYPNSPIKFSFKSRTKTLIISLSDIHVGASVSNNSIYYNEWNEEELNNRLDGKIYKDKAKTTLLDIKNPDEKKKLVVRPKDEIPYMSLFVGYTEAGETIGRLGIDLMINLSTKLNCADVAEAGVDVINNFNTQANAIEEKIMDTVATVEVPQPEVK